MDRTLPKIRRAIQSLLILFIIDATLVIPQPAFAQNTTLLVQSGTTMTVAGNNLVLNNTDLQCNGTFNASNGTVSITGSNSTSFSGAGTPLMEVLTMNTSTTSTLTLNCTLQVSTAVNFLNGLIDLNGQQLQLGNTGALESENETSRITGITGGSVTASATAVSNPNQLDIGNLGAVLTTTANLGNLVITRSHKPAVNPGNGALQGIQRTFLIQPQNDAALNATLRFYYFNAELNGDDPNTLSLWSSNDGVTWMQVGVDSRNTTSKYVEKAGLANLSYWTLTDAGDPLPLTLVSFKVICQDQYALIQWQTGTEISLDHFEIERSGDGANWVTIGEVAATDNPNGASYAFKDPDPPATAYYRLKMVDMSGSFGYSPVFQGSCSDIALPFMVYPNPASTETVAEVSVRQSATGTIQLVSMNGQLLYNAVWSLQPGINQYVLPVSRYAAGTYIVRLLINGGTMETKLNKR
jgi:type IX secretion system substrate protein